MSGGVWWCLMHVWWCPVVSMYIGRYDPTCAIFLKNLTYPKIWGLSAYPDTTRHHQTPPDMLQTPPDMHETSDNGYVSL